MFHIHKYKYVGTQTVHDLNYGESNISRNIEICVKCGDIRHTSHIYALPQKYLYDIKLRWLPNKDTLLEKSISVREYKINKLKKL